MNESEFDNVKDFVNSRGIALQLKTYMNKKADGKFHHGRLAES